MFGWKRGLYLAGHGGVGLALRLAGIRFRVVGRENVPPGAVVYCSNHESNVDPAVLFQGLHPMLHILYKAELHQIPLMGMAFDLGGFVAVDRADRRKSIASVDRAVESLRGGQLVPHLSRGHPQPHRRAAAVQEGRLHHGASGAGADGAGRGERRPRVDAEGERHRPPGHGDGADRPPIYTQGMTVDDRDTLIEQVRTAVQRLLDQGSAWN